MRLFRRRQPEPLRYYLYISDTKLDMLFEQISVQARKRISAEVRVDLKLASITLREADDTAPARSAKLRIVERFIDEYHHMGTVAEPGREYFRGSLPMQWGWFLGQRVRDLRDYGKAVSEESAAVLDPPEAGPLAARAIEIAVEVAAEIADHPARASARHAEARRRSRRCWRCVGCGDAVGG